MYMMIGFLILIAVETVVFSFLEDELINSLIATAILIMSGFGLLVSTALNSPFVILSGIGCCVGLCHVIGSKYKRTALGGAKMIFVKVKNISGRRV